MALVTAFNIGVSPIFDVLLFFVQVNDVCISSNFLCSIFTSICIRKCNKNLG